MSTRRYLAALLATPPRGFALQAAVVFGLGLLVALRWWLHATVPTPINDEIPYMRAIDLVRAGESPYRGGYLYPPLLAVVGAWIVERFGAAPFLWLLRALCYLGVATTVWLALRSVPWRPWLLPAAALYLCLAPAVWFGVEVHNISLLISGIALFALWIWPERPLVAGALLGLGAVLKPMVVVIPFLLLAHRPAGGGMRHRIAGGVAIAVAAALLVTPPYLREMLALASREATIPRSVSFHRLAYLAGWEDSAIWVSAAIALVALVFVMRNELGRLEFLAIASIASLMATPVLWSHTLVLALPVQVMMLERLHRRRRHEHALRLEPVVVLLTIAALQFSGGAGSVDDRGSLFQVYSTLPIALAPLVAAGYLMWSGGIAEPVEDSVERL